VEVISGMIAKRVGIAVVAYSFDFSRSLILMGCRFRSAKTRLSTVSMGGVVKGE
jgi:hypothetical protein